MPYCGYIEDGDEWITLTEEDLLYYKLEELASYCTPLTYVSHQVAGNYIDEVIAKYELPIRINTYTRKSKSNNGPGNLFSDYCWANKIDGDYYKGVVALYKNGSAVSIDTLLHEVAHVLCPPDNNHNKVFRKTFIDLLYKESKVFPNLKLFANSLIIKCNQHFKDNLCLI